MINQFKNKTIQRLHDLGMLGEWRGKVAELLLDGSDIYERYCGPDGIFNVDDPCFGKGIPLDKARATVPFSLSNDENLMAYEACKANLFLQDDAFKFQSMEGDYHFIDVWFATKMHVEGDPPKGVPRETTTYDMTRTDLDCLIGAIRVFLLDDDHANDNADFLKHHAITRYHGEYQAFNSHAMAEHVARTLLARAEEAERTHPGVSLFEGLC